ncbi:Enolase-phosphatase E1 [Tyrophagus putrescentiae]|nr:Enolase-phosphatase E1 [Tyrophagus putrescentiae]
MVIVKVKKPLAVVFDFCGTAARDTFVEKTLQPYFKLAYKAYFEANWSKEECQADAKALAAIDLTAAKQEQIAALAKYVEYCGANKKDTSKAFVMYRFHVWFDGYDRGKLTTPVYSDVAVHIQKWKTELQLKLFIFSNGWTEATKKFMSKTSHGDLNALIDDHFDTSLGSLKDAATYRKLIERIKEDPKEVTFLTKSASEGKAAKAAGLNVVLVLTHTATVEAVSTSCKDIPIARSFTQVEFI